MVPNEGEVVKGNDYFSVQFLDSNLSDIAKKLSIKSGVSTFDYSECEKVLRKQYNISESVPLRYSKIDFDHNLNKSLNGNITFGDSIKVNIYNSLNNKLLNKSFCDQTPSQTLIPSTPIQDKVDKIKARLKDIKIVGRYLSQIDISNKADPIFNDRCIKFSTNTGSTLTVNERRGSFYPNTSLSCDSSKTNENSTCIYEGMDENYYAKCKCTGIQETKNIFEDAFLESLSDININIVLCHIQVLAFVIILYLLLITLFTLFSLVSFQIWDYI